MGMREAMTIVGNGVESSFEKSLRGSDGIVSTERDAAGGWDSRLPLKWWSHFMKAILCSRYGG